MSLTSTYQKISQGSHFQVSMLLGAFAAMLTPAAHAQAAPQTIPYINNIYAGTGVTYTPATVKGSATTPVHGTSPGDGTAATSAGVELSGPTLIAVDSLGNVYFTDSTGPVRKVDTSGNISTFAGGLSTGAGDCANSGTSTIGDGCPANETFVHTGYGIAIDPASGDIYLSEETGERVRKISHSSYLMSSVVDVAGTKSGLDGDLTTCSTTAGATCSGTAGTVNGPRGLAVDKHGNLYIMDEGNFAVRLANFTTGQLTTIVNTAKTKATATTCGTDAVSGGVTAASASLGVASAIAFDNADNLYITDATCNYVFKVAENPTTHMVDGASILSVVMGSGGSTPATVFTNQPGLLLSFTPAGVAVDPQGNLYVGESTGTHVWFLDHATGNVHTVFGGGGTGGNCFAVPASGTSPFNGCDGNDATLANTKGTGGLALDAWGDLYITDSASFVVHKLSLGTSPPFATTPSGNQNATLHFGANDMLNENVTTEGIATTLAPDFSFQAQTATCAPNPDNTQDCGVIVSNTNSSTSAQYEQVTVTGTDGLSTVIPLTNQAVPTCQPATATSLTVHVTDTTSAVTLSSQPGAACSGFETTALSPHQYSYAVVSGPAHGTLSGTAPNLTYTATGATDNDSFTYSVTDNSTFKPASVSYDGGASSITLETPTPLVGAIGTVSIQPYAPPVATAQSVTVTYSTSQNITLAGTDFNNATLTFAVASQPVDGTLTGTAPNLIYTPASTYSGPDSFTFTVNDGIETSAPATVLITVNQVAPVASSQSVTTAFATPVLITLVATGNGTLTYAVAAQPLHGSVSLSGAVATYTPTAGYSGVDSFTFTASSGQVSNAAKVSITVLPAPPVAASQTIAAASFNAAEAITLSATGATPITYAIVAQPAHGTVTLAGAVATYTPAVNFAGNDSFTFTASNAGGTSNVATVSVSVTEGFTWYAASGGSLSASVTNGQTATFNLAIGGWTGASGVSVAFTCVGAPVLCNVTPNPVTLSGATPVPVTVTINTLTTTVTPTSFGWLSGSGKGGPWLLLLNLVWLVFFVPQARRRRAIWRVAVALAAMVTLASVTGCGGNIPEKAFGTPAGTYAFTVSATAAATTTATQTITLIVN